MSIYAFLNETILAIALVCSIAAIAAIAIVSGPDAIAPTHLPDIALALGAGLIGAKIPTSSKDAQ